MKKTLDKLKKFWLLYKSDKPAFHAAAKFALMAWWAHRRAGWASAKKTAIGYFKLGLAWSGFKMPERKSKK